MKIKMLKNIDVDIFKSRLNETWPKYFYRFDQLNVERIEDIGNNSANLVLDNGDVVMDIPKNAYEHQS